MTIAEKTPKTPISDQVIIVSLSSMMRSLGMGASWPFMAIFLNLKIRGIGEFMAYVAVYLYA